MESRARLDSHRQAAFLDVDRFLSQSRKTDKIASSDVARSRVNSITSHTKIYPLWR
jgi:hypothetical protein